MDESQEQQQHRHREANLSAQWVPTNGINDNGIVVLSTFAQVPPLPERFGEITPAVANITRTTSSTGLPTTAAAMRTQIKRGRTGCFTCRKRRKKCDETKPRCKFVRVCQ